MNKTWRNILPGILFMVACTSLAQAQTIDVTKPIIGKLTAVGDGWSPIEIVDVAQAPLDEHPRFRTKSKTIFKGPEVGALIYSVFVPAWNSRPLTHERIPIAARMIAIESVSTG